VNRLRVHLYFVTHVMRQGISPLLKSWLGKSFVMFS
jgi:hypothetical protein